MTVDTVDIPRISASLALLFCLAASGCSGCDDRTSGSPDAADVAIDTSDASDTTTPSDGSRTADTLDTSDTVGASDASDTSDVVDASDTSGRSDAVDASDTTAADPDADARDTADTTADTLADGGDTSTDTSPADTGPQPPSGLSTRCSNGPGWTLFKFHWTHNSGPSPRIDVWDATCNYSFAAGSACNVQDIRNPGFNSSRRQPKAILLTTSEYLRVRFSVDGLNFSKADVYAQARSYDTTSSTKFRVSSPLYGSKKSPLVDNDFTYDWYRVDWNGYLKPSDDPDLTAIEIYGTGGTVAVHAVEVCIR